jgi:predicted ATP-dependent endonuclease of OLD family
MIVKSVHVRNLRSVQNETLHCEQLTALVGPNGSGKSTFLRALDLFYSPSPKVDLEDFYDEDCEQDIEIAVTFTDLGDDEKNRFQSYMEGEDLTVVRVLSVKDGKQSAKYHGSSLQNPDFATVRSASKAAERKVFYEAVRGRFADLPKWTKQEEALDALTKWELAHAEQCKRGRDDGQFFGFTEVARGYLGKDTRFIYVPAVRDAALDAQEGRGSAITQLMDLVVRKALADSKAVKQLRDDMRTRYDEIMDPSKRTELVALTSQLAQTLQTYVPNADLQILWAKGSEIEIPLPQADVKVVEDGYASAVTRAGHGLQRAFILTMLQHLSVEQGREREDGDTGDAEKITEKVPTVRMPNLVVGIEEPELYQHPNRQRHFARVLLQLTRGEVRGVAKKTQMIYCTHSPLFVDIDRFDQVRRLQKAAVNDGKPKVTRVAKSSLDKVAEIIWEANDRKDRKGNKCEKFTGATLKPRLQALMTPWMNEGFFADVVVLVEGEDDRAAIMGMGLLLEHDLERDGISVIPSGGKDSLDRPAAIFREFGIPVYMLWDGDAAGKDKDKSIRVNHRLLRLCNTPLEDFPEAITDRFACFKDKLETTLASEIGTDLFAGLLESAQERFSYGDKESAMKSPHVLHHILTEAKAKGKTSNSLKAIVEQILTLKK